MKTYKSIVQKFNYLVKQYRQEVKKYGYDENISTRYMDKFNNFIGDIFNYEYFTRQNIILLQKNLFNCVTNPIG